MAVSPLVFIHVPKTAGTSFRLGMDQYFGREQVCRDYGAGSPETSPIAAQWVHERKDLWAFRRQFEQSGYQFLTGHFGAQRYLPAFPLGNMLTFLRDPLQRAVSEYHHLVKYMGYEQDLPHFFRSPEYVNRQHKMFQGVPWIALGLVGITEMYDESLAQLKHKFGLDIPRLETNTGRENWREPYTLPEAQEKEFRRLNAADFRFYDLARTQLEWRTRLAGRGDPFVVGMITEYRENNLHGWAYSEKSDDAALIRVTVNGELKAEVGARLYRQGLRAFGVPRGANVGFSVKLPGLTSEDLVECTVATTGQPLANSGWRKPKSPVAKK